MKEEIERLYNEKYLYAMAVKMTKDQDLAEDLAQDTVIHLYNIEHMYTNRNKLPSFVKTVMKRLWLNKKRRREIEERYLANQRVINSVIYEYYEEDRLPDQCYLTQLIERVTDSKDKEYLKLMITEHNYTDIQRIFNIDYGIVKRNVLRIRQEISR